MARIQFGLKAWLVVFVMLAVLFAWAGHNIHMARQKRHAYSIIITAGASIQCDSPSASEFEEDANSLTQLVHDLISVDQSPAIEVHLVNSELSAALAEACVSIDCVDHLNLDCVSIADRSAETLSKIHGLRRLTLRHPTISYVGLNCLLSMPSLKEVEAYRLAQNNHDLTCLAKLQQLELLSLTHCSIDKETAEAICSLPLLQVLDLQYSRLSVGSLEQFTSLKSLRHLNLQGIPLTNEVLVRIGKMSSLVGLNIAYTKIPDMDVSHLCALEDLQNLSLSGCALTDDELQHLLRLPRLKALSLIGTQITDVSVRRLGELAQLERLSVTVDRGVTRDAVAEFKRNNPRVKVTVVPSQSRG